MNPVGYVGGTGDDVHYLQAARCWAAHAGPCLPTDHWMARWPVTGPIAAAIAWFGENRLAVGAGSLPAWIGTIVLVGWLGRLWFDRVTGLVAAAVMASVPIFTQAALQPGADITELMFQLGAAVAATVAYRSQSSRVAALAGGMAALAVQTRETSLVLCALVGLAWLVLDRRSRKLLLWSALGFGILMLAEAAVYFWATGDALYRTGLSLNHTRIVSQELPPGFDRSQSPVLNAAYIQAWRREMGIHWWWPIDPWLNLIASPRIGLVFVGAALLGLTQWRRMDRNARTVLRYSVLTAALVALLLVYVLGVDPKARMFLLQVTIAALVIGASASASIRAGEKGLPLLIVGALILTGIFTLSRIPQTRDFEVQAQQWMMRYPGQLSIDPSVSTTLALLPGLSDLPEDPASRRYRLTGGNAPCAAYGGVPVARTAEVGNGRLCLNDMRIPHR